MSKMQYSGKRCERWPCAVLLAIGCISFLANADESPDGDRNAAQAAVLEYGATLKAALGAALATGDLVAALDVCAGEAPGIARTVAAQSGITVGRTSEKTRNPANRPADWQLAVLHEWQADKSRGIDISQRDYFSAQPDGGLRYMRPIFIQPACLVCHGEIQSTELQMALDARYPADRATGYQVGDLRGAFVAQR